jgi:hypothetical protein
MKETICALLIFLILGSATASALKTRANSLPVSTSWQQDLSGYVKIANVTGGLCPDVIVGGGGTVYAFDGHGNAVWNLTGLQAVSTLEIGDINNDGLDEILALTGAGFSRGPDGYESANATLCAINSSGVLLWEHFLSALYSGGGQHVISIGDINGDGRKEIAVDGFQRVMVFDYLGNEMWTYDLSSAHIGNIQMGDLDGNGIDEVVVTYWTNIYSGGVLALDGRGNLLWNYPTQAGMKALAIADLNGDGKNEVVASSYETLGAKQGIYLISGSGSLVWYQPYAKETNSIAIGDIDGDGVNDIVAGTDLGDIFILDRNGTIIWSTNFTATPIAGVAIGDFDGSEKKNEVAACGSYFSLNPSRQDGTWVFDDKGNMIWEFSSQINFFSLASGDINGDGIDDVVVSTVDLENQIQGKTYALTAGAPVRTSIAATVDFSPGALNLMSHGDSLACYIELPEGYNVADINVTTISLNNTISAESGPTVIGDYNSNSIPYLMVTFNRTELVNLMVSENITLANVTLTLNGNLDNGTQFEGSSIIPVSALMGDVNCDGKVNLLDLASVAYAYHSRPGDSNWNPNADFAQPWGIISLTDLVTIGVHYGQHF